MDDAGMVHLRQILRLALKCLGILLCNPAIGSGRHRSVLVPGIQFLGEKLLQRDTDLRLAQLHCNEGGGAVRDSECTLPQNLLDGVTVLTAPDHRPDRQCLILVYHGYKCNNSFQNAPHSVTGRTERPIWRLLSSQPMVVRVK